MFLTDVATRPGRRHAAFANQMDVRPADLAAGLRAKLGRLGSSRGDAVILTDREGGPDPRQRPARTTRLSNCATVNRCPRMHDWPPILPGSMVMRSRPSIQPMCRPSAEEP
jgi:hypothetical protein